MNSKQELGKKGEEIACIYLENRGYKIIEKNFFCKLGEIDIIVKQENTVIFIEVKTRKNKKFGNPAEAVNKRKQIHMYNVAKYYILIKGLRNIQLRFDVIEIMMERGEFKINHIKQIL